MIDPRPEAMVAGSSSTGRGDPSLFADGMRLIAERTGWPALGLVPHFPDAARLPAEDVLGLAGSDPRGPAPSRWRCRCCRASPISTISTRCGRSRTCRWCWSGPERRSPPGPPSCCCRSEDHDRRPGGFPREGWDVDLRAHVRRAAGCSACAAATRCWATASPTRTGSRGRPGRCRASGSSPSTP